MPGTQSSYLNISQDFRVMVIDIFDFIFTR